VLYLGLPLHALYKFDVELEMLLQTTSLLHYFAATFAYAAMFHSAKKTNALPLIVP
jgi:hypothetical protein